MYLVRAMRRPVRVIVLFGAMVMAAALPAAAHADALVYMKNRQVWVANPDTSGARAFTIHDFSWAWPSMADDGTVAAAGGVARSDSQGSSEIYRFDGHGNQIGVATPT